MENYSLPIHSTYSPFQGNQSTRLCPIIPVSSTIVTAGEAHPTAATPQTEASSNGCSNLAAWSSVKQQSWEGDLEVEGHIPLWVRGTYIRNGPGLWQVGNHHFRHLFDGYATLVRLSFSHGKLSAGHRQLHSSAYLAAMQTQKLTFREFSEAPQRGRGFLAEVAGLLSGRSLTDNANTGVVRLGDGRVVCLTETVKGSIEINPETLDTVGRFKFEDSLGGLIHSAHPVVTESEFLTLLPDLVRPGYLVVRMPAGSSRREVVGRVACGGGPAPGWVHSFPVTEKYIVVPEMPLRYSVKNLLREEPTPLYKFQWHPESKAFFHIMCRTSGRMVSVRVWECKQTRARLPLKEKRKKSHQLGERIVCIFVNFKQNPSTYGPPCIPATISISGELLTSSIFPATASFPVKSVEVPLFLTFHFINAFEEEDDIIVDCCEHNADPRILDMLRMKNLRSFSGEDTLPDARIGRFRIPRDGSGAELEDGLSPDEHGRGIDMCTINPSMSGKKYKFTYACGARRPCNFPNTLTKVDLVGKRADTWYEDDAIPSEPYFVARPGSTAEDDGVVISLVSQSNGEGYALILDGQTFEEIARAKLPYGLPYGLHGCWIQHK